MTHKLFVGSISFKASDKDLEDHFAEHVNVVSAKIITDRDTGRSRGFGFVEVETTDDVKTAIQKLNNSSLAGRNIVVNEARDKERTGR